MATVKLLQTIQLSRHFGGLRALNNVDFTLPKGQIRALIGPNGAGKSTFVSVVCGRIAASSGSVIFDGMDVTNMPVHKRISAGMAYTFQITSIFPGLTAHENVALAVRRHHGGEAETMAALQGVGLAERAGQIAGDLSYGHQRLLEIAMGLGQNPKLLILDEPTQGLADSEIEQFNSTIRTIAGDTTILLIEHNMDVVMEIAEFITVLNFGEVLAQGTPDEIRASKAVQEAYLGGGDA